MNPVLCLEPGGKVEIVVVEDHVVAELEVKPKGPTALVSHQELLTGPKQLTVLLPPLLVDMPCELHSIREDGKNIIDFVLIFAED